MIDAGGSVMEGGGGGCGGGTGVVSIPRFKSRLTARIDSDGRLTRLTCWSLSLHVSVHLLLCCCCRFLRTTVRVGPPQREAVLQAPRWRTGHRSVVVVVVVVGVFARAAGARATQRAERLAQVRLSRLLSLPMIVRVLLIHTFLSLSLPPSMSPCRPAITCDSLFCLCLLPNAITGTTISSTASSLAVPPRHFAVAAVMVLLTGRLIVLTVLVVVLAPAAALIVALTAPAAAALGV